MKEMTKQAWERFVLSAHEAVHASSEENPDFVGWIQNAVEEYVHESERHVQTSAQKRLNKEKALVEMVRGSLAFPESTPEEYSALAPKLQKVFEEKLERNLYAYGDPELKNFPLPENTGDFANASPLERLGGWLGNITELFSKNN